MQRRLEESSHRDKSRRRSGEQTKTLPSLRVGFKGKAALIAAADAGHERVSRAVRLREEPFQQNGAGQGAFTTFGGKAAPRTKYALR